jgi:hypothetical protein
LLKDKAPMILPRKRIALTAAALLVVGCDGLISGGARPITTVGPNGATCPIAPRPGHTMIHRLTNVEYDNTVRDLLFVPSTHGASFASSSVGSSGFTNQSDVLTISDQLLADYGHAAEAIADQVLATKGTAGGAWSLVAGCIATTATPDTTCVQAAVRTLGDRAFRRPIEDDDLAQLMTVYAAESTPADGFHDVIMAVLLDPRFAFSYVAHPSPDDPTVVQALDGYELASRLSYFLWQSMPDDTLRALAAAGTLKDPTVLQAQVVRMLGDPKAASFANVFRRDWARLSLLEGTNGYGTVSAQTVADLRQETQLLMQDVLASDRSLLTLVSGDHTFVNQNLASYYGWSLPGLSTTTFTRVAIPQAERRGLLTSGAVMLTAGGGATYTHPVQRGRWVMDSLFCAPPPPPPAGVSTVLPMSSSNLPMRDRLTQHTQSTACSGCHASMDLWGLGLENFDMAGQWRTTYAALANLPIDASGVLADGRTFSGPAEMLGVLAADPAVPACLAQKLMTFALTRPMSTLDDTCTATTLGVANITPTSTLSGLVTQLVQTPQFQSQEGAAP